MNQQCQANLIESLGGRGEKLLLENLHTEENVLVKLKGNFGEAFVITNKRIYVLKWGFMAGNIIGGRCLAFDFERITGLDINKSFLNGSVEVLTASTQNAQRSYWDVNKSGAVKSDNVVSFQTSRFKAFQEAVNVGRELINKNKSGDHNNSNYDELEKLAKLKEKHIITDEEFNAKKKQILGI